MKTRTLIAFACAAALNGLCAPLSTASSADPLVRFWLDNDGKTVRRLPVDVVPENVFWGFGTRDFPDNLKAFNRMIDESVAKSTYNCVTLTLRCNPELGDPETMAAAKKVCEKAHAAGIKVFMDTDPRIARREFFARWPNDMQGVAVVVTAVPTNGVAAFTYVFKDATDHMTGGARNAYRPVAARVAAAFAVRKRADGAFDFSTRRPVDVAPEIAVRKRRDESRGGYMDRSDAVVSGKAAGLAADETLVVTLEADYFSADVFSPHIIPFARELMARYKALGADGGMRDEWGLIPDHAPSLHKFWWSPNFEAAYRAACGRSLMDDFPQMALGAKGDAARAAAIGTFMKLVLARNVEIERDFYETDKRLFGAGVYVAKHPTWHSAVCPQEYFHNGLDWWQAPRDWAQGSAAPYGSTRATPPRPSATSSACGRTRCAAAGKCTTASTVIRRRWRSTTRCPGTSVACARRSTSSRRATSRRRRVCACQTSSRVPRWIRPLPTCSDTNGLWTGAATAGTTTASGRF